MAKIREIKRRVRSVQTTAQMTHAMQLVAAAKMRRAQDAARNGRPYGEKLEEILGRMTASIDRHRHPLMKVRDGKRILLLFITPDRGLCGPLIAHLTRALLTHPELYRARQEGSLTLLTIGQKGNRFAQRSGTMIEFDFPVSNQPPFSLAVEIARTAMRHFLAKKVDRVAVLYAHFASTMRQDIRLKILLPIHAFTISDELGTAHAIQSTEKKPSAFMFEPNIDAILEAILPHYVEMWIYHFLLEASASEHSARMVAMKQATDNANEIIADLRLTMNRLRQESITNELLDIVTANTSLEDS